MVGWWWWGCISEDFSASQQVRIFEEFTLNKLDQYCPEKVIKISSQDSPWINSELKTIHRQKGREYNKRGKSKKYKILENSFKTKSEAAAEKYLRKNVDELKQTNPGKAYRIIKQMGAQPGDCSEGTSFTLPNHEGEKLTDEQSAERIAQHFADISQQFPPLNISLLPECVTTKLESESTPPTIEDYEVYEKIKSAKKPLSGVPGDLPRLITKEFAPELAKPICRIINSIVRTAEWPTQWKLEFVTPIGKIPMPETEDDLRPISLTPFFSKVTEHFVVMWLLDYIGEKIDFRQYGGTRGNSITHYLIEFINFILFNQDSSAPIAILACMVDFSKAFNRQNHNLLVTKLSDMGVPAWLLKIVMAFLSDRNMIVRYKGKQSTPKYLPGGGPQGTLLGLLLFLVLINDAGFDGQTNNTGEVITTKKNLKAANVIHLKYVDDLTLAESINLKDKLVYVPESERPLPDNFHAKTGHVLPIQESQVLRQLQKTKEYSDKNEMMINKKKTKMMLFNPCRKWDFMPDFTLEDQEINLVEEMKLLGVVIQSDMKWTSNTEAIVKKAFKRLWSMRRLSTMGADVEDLKDVYTKQVRSLLELAVPAWQAAITKAERQDIERVQKTAIHIMLGDGYKNYSDALEFVGLETLESRRQKLCLKFAKKCVNHPKHTNWFKECTGKPNTRQEQTKYWPVYTDHDRYYRSPISYLTRLLNENDQK